MVYDIASKRLVDLNPRAFLEMVLNRPIADCQELTALPQELTAIKRADHVWLARFPDERRAIVLMEFLSHWDAKKKLSLAIYDLLLTDKYETDVETILLLYLPNQQADPVFEKRNFRYVFRLIKLWEMDAQILYNSGQLSLYPLLPLMKGGLSLIDAAGCGLLESELERDQKGDLLAIMGIFLGLTDPTKAANFLSNRSQLMETIAESPFYKWIEEEGRGKGLREGIQLGLERGRQEGRQEGLAEAVKLGLELRFGAESFPLFSVVERSRNIAILEKAEQALRNGDSLASIKALLLADGSR